MRSSALVTFGAAALAAAVFAVGANAGPPWGPETPPFNLEVILRDVTGGQGFGHVKFRQRNDDERIINLDTWVRDLQPNHDYLLQRAVDTSLDGNCTSTAWLTLGEGFEVTPITTDDRGTKRVAFFRNLDPPGPMTGPQPGTAFDIHFRVIDAATLLQCSRAAVTGTPLASNSATPRPKGDRFRGGRPYSLTTTGARGETPSTASSRPGLGDAGEWPGPESNQRHQGFQSCLSGRFGRRGHVRVPLGVRKASVSPRPIRTPAMDEEHPRHQVPRLPAACIGRAWRSDQRRRVPSHGLRFRNRLVAALRDWLPADTRTAEEHGRAARARSEAVPLPHP